MFIKICNNVHRCIGGLERAMNTILVTSQHRSFCVPAQPRSTSSKNQRERKNNSFDWIADTPEPSNSTKKSPGQAPQITQNNALVARSTQNETDDEIFRRKITVDSPWSGNSAVRSINSKLAKNIFNNINDSYVIPLLEYYVDPATDKIELNGPFAQVLKCIKQFYRIRKVY